MGVLALSAQSVTEALAGAALQPRLRRLLVSMETTQSGLEPWNTNHDCWDSKISLITVTFHRSRVINKKNQYVPHNKQGSFNSTAALIHEKHRFIQNLLPDKIKPTSTPAGGHWRWTVSWRQWDIHVKIDVYILMHCLLKPYIVYITTVCPEVSICVTCLPPTGHDWDYNNTNHK